MNTTLIESPPILQGTLLIGTWNLRAARVPFDVRGEVAKFVKAKHIKVLATQEAQAYANALNSIPGYRYITFERDPSARDSGLLVKDGQTVSDIRLHRLSRITWARLRIGGVHWPRSAVSAVVDGVMYISVHLPPGGLEANERARRKAYRQCMKRLNKIIKRSKFPVVVLGDWNMQREDEGKFSPQWLANKHGMRMAGGQGIDFALLKRVRLGWAMRLKAWQGDSDHAPVVLLVHP